MSAITCVICDNQNGKEIGIGKFGSISSESGLPEITINDVRMSEQEFEPAGPFRLQIENETHKNCKPTNFKNLRSGYTYDRVIFVPG